MYSTSPHDALWRQLASEQLLRRGWHLTRIDCQSDFILDELAVEGVAASLSEHLRELSHAISTNTFRPHPLVKIDVPKNALGVRPGAVIDVTDRIVLHACILLVARQLDELLPKGVYSYRVKNLQWRRGKSIFAETDIYDLPYLKRKTIRRDIDPFEPWYARWPAFDKASRAAFKSYRFLATSDIAAYFENIQIELLRDVLLKALPIEHKLINFICGIFSEWSEPDISGRRHARGIPQGSDVSSFFGNFFLYPLDKALSDFSKENGARYYRYMDDVRVFCRDQSSARKAVILIEDVLRKLRLNAQSAKTKILDERYKEISSELIDSRVDRAKIVVDKVSAAVRRGSLATSEKEKFKDEVRSIVRAKPENKKETVIVGSTRPLSGLTLRALRLAVHAAILLEDGETADLLVKEALRSYDHRLTRQLARYVRAFPRRRKIQDLVMDYIESDANIFPHQEAELIHALRYSAELSARVIAHCKARLLSEGAHYYIKAQSACLLARVRLAPSELRLIKAIINNEKNPVAKLYMSSLLLQRRPTKLSSVVRWMYLHQNERISQFGKIIRPLRVNANEGLKAIDSIFDRSPEWVLVDRIGHIRCLAGALNPDVKSELKTQLSRKIKKCRFAGLKPIFKDIATVL